MKRAFSVIVEVYSSRDQTSALWRRRVVMRGRARPFGQPSIVDHHNMPIQNNWSGVRSSNTVGGFPPSVTPEMAA